MGILNLFKKKERGLTCGFSRADIDDLVQEKKDSRKIKELKRLLKLKRFSFESNS